VVYIKKMKLFLSQADLNIAYHIFLRQAGYTYIENRKTGQGSFVRPFGRNNYPRFHVYVIEEDDKIVFNAHLDQKQASYEGSSAHSGEYDSPLVKEELERLRALLEKGSVTLSRSQPRNHKSFEDSSTDSRERRWSNLIKDN
jgi:hypothetical protein